MTYLLVMLRSTFLSCFELNLYIGFVHNGGVLRWLWLCTWNIQGGEVGIKLENELMTNKVSDTLR
jgi:hypothetical protein